MNDPGLDEPIGEVAEDIEDRIGDEGTHTAIDTKKTKSKKKNDDDEKQKEKRFLRSKYQIQKDNEELRDLKDGTQSDEDLSGHLWMFATLYPLTAATLGPIANVMSICALCYPWRVYIRPGTNEGVGVRIEDPKWVLAINGISLASGVGANVMLLLNLAKRISPTLAQPVTIALWYLASILLIALIGVNSTSLRLYPREEHAYSEAYYYAIIASSLYFFIASLLSCNFTGALMGKYNRHFNLSVPQRTMMLQTMSLMMWICLGAGVFARLERWVFIEGVYFCVVTILTVGMGDFVITTNAGRALLFPFAAIGVVTLGLVVGSIRGLVLERAKRKVKRRMLEKLRASYVEDGKASSSSDEKEFEIMRQVQSVADRRRKWMSLLTSTFWVTVFWLLGALVFFKSEVKQEWTYFQSVYFVYTSLLTIGYGDFTPYSNSGKPFFVIWSILAVPAMTILISNMGDTVIVGVKDVTLWIGEYTLLPEQRGRQRMEKKQGHKWSHSHDDEDNTAAAKDEEKDIENEDATTNSLRETGEALVGAEQAEEEAADEKDEQESGNNNNNTTEKHDRHKTIRLHHKLAIALQEILPDLGASPPKRYPYDRWRRYLDLINEADEFGMHDAPSSKENTKRTNSISAAELKGAGKRDWMDEDSPLMAKGTEAEWLVKALAVRLEGGLRREIRNL